LSPWKQLPSPAQRVFNPLTSLFPHPRNAHVKLIMIVKFAAAQ